jgi:hypothetical protein
MSVGACPEAARTARTFGTIAASAVHRIKPISERISENRLFLVADIVRRFQGEHGFARRGSVGGDSDFGRLTRVAVLLYRL